MLCRAEFNNLKKDYKFYVETKTPDDMAEFISENFKSYIELVEITNYPDQDILAFHFEEDNWL